MTARAEPAPVNPFTARRPWAAALVTLLASPPVGMAYLNRGWSALAYVLAELVVLAVALFWEPAVLIAGDLGTFYSIGILCIVATGVVHAAVIAKNRDPAEQLKWYARWPAVVAFVVIPVGVTLSIRTWFFQSFSSPSASMTPAVNAGDNFIVDKRAYDAVPPQRGDVIAFRSMGTEFVKRVVGLPGDRVQMVGGKFYLNGVVVPERRVGATAGGDGEMATVLTETLPDGRSYEVLDEGPDGAFDNTEPFVVPPHAYFVMGDNRDDSDDSRGHIGFVRENDIIGKVSVVWWDGLTNSFTSRPIQ